MSFIKPRHKHKDYVDLSDEELVRQILLTKKRALQEALYERYVERVFHKCLSIVNNQATAEDLTHDVMVKVFTKLAKYREKSPFYGWIFAITYNHCMDYLKLQQKLKLTTYEEYQLEVPETDAIEKEHKILQEIRYQQLEQVFEKLNKAEKMILMMRYQDAMSIRQIAIVLNISESAVKMRLKRSRDRLAVLVKSSAYAEQ